MYATNFREDLSRKVGKEDIPTLDSQLQFIEKSIKDISKVIEHAKVSICNILFHDWLRHFSLHMWKYSERHLSNIS